MKLKKLVVSLFTLALIGTLSPISVKADSEVTGNFVFDLQATVYDYGEAINSVSFSIKPIDPTGLAGAEIDLSTVTKDTFEIKATSTNPYASIPVDAPQYGLYTNVTRDIQDISVSSDGRVLSMDLKTVYNGAGQGTLNYVAGTVGRNLSMDINYTVTQIEDFSLKNGTVIKADSTYTMGKIVSSEVEKFSAASYAGSKSTINYQQFTPSNSNDGQKHPLIIWFHGNGEGGFSDLQNNNSQLRANRGAVTFASEEAQQIFGGAYVLAPQAPDTWYNNYTNGYIDTMTSLINDYAATNNVDTNRIYVYGCSAGGYMTTRMAIENPNLFAAVVPTCPALDVAYDRGGVATTDEEIKSLSTQNIWLVQAKNDATVLEKDCAGRMAGLLDNAIYTPYDTVNVDGIEYSGHWSWIYTARNMPTYKGQTLFEWTAKQTLAVEEVPEPEPVPKPKPVPTPSISEITKPSVVATGDSTVTTLYGTLALLSMGAMLTLINKKRYLN